MFCSGLASQLVPRLLRQKPLAKLCDHYTKTFPVFDGVLNCLELSEFRRAKANLVNREPHPRKVEGHGHANGLDFACMAAALVRRRFGMVLERTYREINGVSCIPLEEIAPGRQQIVRTRSFAQIRSDINSLWAAVSVHIADTVRTLRLQKSAASSAGILFHSDPFKANALHMPSLNLSVHHIPTQTCLLSRTKSWNSLSATSNRGLNTRTLAYCLAN